jgi:hypothetical protein
LISRRILRFNSCAAVVLLTLSLSAWAQFAQRGGLAGTVFDASGAVVADTEITLLDVAQNQSRTLKTDKGGHFAFPDLTAGQYRLTASHDGFQTETSEAITVNLGVVANYDFRLHPGSTHETLTVTSEAAAALETQDANVETNITARQFEDLPLDGRNFTAVAALAPGVSTYPQPNINPQGTFSIGAQFAMGGTIYAVGGSFVGSRDNGFYINGVNANDNYVGSISFAPSAEAIGTGTVQIADFSAAIGHDISAINIQTKGGGNKFHGEGYDFLENTDLNAFNPWSNALQIITGAPATKPSLIRNQFGGNLGGPIPIPGLKNRFFFFVNYEDFIEHDGNQEVAASVPSAAERTGDFSELCGPPQCGGVGTNPNPIQLYNPFLTTYDPNTGISSRPPVTGNRLDLAGLVDPASTAILNALYPLPNVPNTPSNAVNFVAFQTPGISNYHIDTRFDSRITDKDNVFVTWSKSNGHATLTGGLSPSELYDFPVQDQSYLVTVNYAHIFSSNLTNEFIFGAGSGALGYTSSQLSWYNGSDNPLNQLFQNTGSSITKGFLAVTASNSGASGIVYPGTYAVPGAGEIAHGSNKSFQYSDNLTWVRGRHMVTTGFNYLRKSEVDWDYQTNAFFGSVAANGFGSNSEQAFSSSGSISGYQGGDGMADLVMGTPTDLWVRYVINGTSTTTAPVYNILFPYWGFYGNDKFRISPKLTVSAGLRYDLSIPDYTPKPSIAPCCAIYTPTSDGGVLEYPGIATGLPTHYLSAPKLDFAPRLSIAYSPNLKTVVRAGYGLYYDTGANVISNNLGNAAYGTSAAVNYNVDNTTLGRTATIDTPYLNLSDIFPSPATTTLGSFPVSTGPGQGYAGVEAFSSITYYDQKSTPLPYIQRFLFDVQRQVADHDVFTVSYAGAQGRKGQNEANINLPPYQTDWPLGGGGGDPSYNAARPNNIGRFGDIYVMRPMINSYYNALIAQYRHDFSRSFQFLSSYTFSKTVGDYPVVNNLAANGVFSGSAVGGFQYPNLNDRGESNQSHRHRFVASGIFTPQYAQRWPLWARLPLSGWRLAGIFTLESGEALTVVNGGPSVPCPASDAGTNTCPSGFGSSAQDGAGFDELFVSGDPNLSHGKKTFSHQFNTAAFSVPPQNVRGNSGFGTVRGPGQNRADISLAKTFSLYESLHLELRADAFNAFNHTNWNGVNTIYPSGSTQFPFGQVNGANEARIIQCAAKVVF